MYRRAFSLLHSSSDKSLFRLTSLVDEGKSPCAGRDNYLHKGTSKSGEVSSVIYDSHDNIGSLSLHESH